MTTSPLCIKVDPERVVQSLREEAVETVNGAEGAVVLDFSSVLRIDTNVLGAMEELASLADERSVKVVLRAVNMDIYKVLKVLKLSHRFSFVN
jgi:anti-anti-sigma regulatory factor